MGLSVKIYTNDDYVGDITLDEDKNLRINPPDSRILKAVVKDYVFDDKREKIYASTDPVLFMERLAYHYRSQGLRASKAESLEAK